MTLLLRSCFTAVSILMVTATMTPRSAFAECKESKIVEYDDRVEVVCVGEPLTPAQIKEKFEEEKRQEAENLFKKSEAEKRLAAENRFKKAEDEKRQKEADLVNLKNKALEDAARKKQENKSDGLNQTLQTIDKSVIKFKQF